MVRTHESQHTYLKVFDESIAAFMYTFGSAGSSRTYQNNLEALNRWRIIPRMLRNTTDRNLEVNRAYLLSAAPPADPAAFLDHPLWRKAPLACSPRSRIDRLFASAGRGSQRREQARCVQRIFIRVTITISAPSRNSRLFSTAMT
jgi:hypothetical protein